MPRTYQVYSLGEGHVQRAPLAIRLGWGFIGGLIGTLAMDILLMGALIAVKNPPFLCFSIVGDTASRFFSLLGMQIIGGVSTGVVAHYMVGPLVGLIFGAAVAMFPALREGSLKKSTIAAVLYVEILSLPLLATTPILLKMTPSVTLLWFGGSFPMHLVFALFLAWSRGADGGRRHPSTPIKSICKRRSLF